MDLSRGVAPEPYTLLPAVPSFTLVSDDLSQGRPIPPECAGPGGVSPHLRWSGFPEGTGSFLVNCYDADAPTPAGWWHWTVADMDGTQTELARGDGESDLTLPGAAFHLRHDGGGHEYLSPGPPSGDRAHRYVFAVHALDVDSLSVSPEDGPSKAAFEAMLHTTARATLTATVQF